MDGSERREPDLTVRATSRTLAARFVLCGLAVVVLACAGPRAGVNGSEDTAPARQDDWELGPDRWATTCDAAARDFLDELTPGGLASFRTTPRDQLVVLHLGLGFRIRDRQGLWRGNTALMASCGKDYPDDASMAILERAWEMEHRKPRRK